MEAGCHTLPEAGQLAELVEEYCPGRESAENLESLSAAARGESRFKHSSGRSHCHRRAGRVLGDLAGCRSDARALQIPSELASKYGPLGHGIDVQGAVALGSPRRPALSINSQIAVELVKRPEEVDHLSSVELVKRPEVVYRLSSAAIYNHVEARKPFTWEGNRVGRDQQGYPTIDNGRLQSWLWTIADEMRDVHDFRLFRRSIVRGGSRLSRGTGES